MWRYFHLFFQRIVSGALGVNGLLVLGLVVMDRNREEGQLSNMKNMVAKNVLEVNEKKDHAIIIYVRNFSISVWTNGAIKREPGNNIQNVNQ